MIVRFTPSVESFADLHRRLGGVPLDRIRMRPPPGTATERDVIAAASGIDRRLCELVDGVLIERATGNYESVLTRLISCSVGNHSEANDSGAVFGAGLGYRLRPGLVRTPSVTFVPWERLPNEEVPDEELATFVPTLVVEVQRDGNTEAETARKVDEFFEAGVELIWVVDRRTETAKVSRSAAVSEVIGSDGVLDGGRLLPGFKLSLADLFAATKRRKKKPR